MNNRVANRWARNPLLVALLLATFCARALVPAGFMPGPGGLMVCNGHMPAAGGASMGGSMAGMDMAGMDMSGMDMSTMDMGADPSHADRTTPKRDTAGHEHGGSPPCPFAAAATAMAGTYSAGNVVSVATEFQSVRIPSLPFVPRGTVVPTRLPRGPPFLA
ncbi:MAG TPA: hypothetical protein VMT49_07950 [Steroidobacteraceae bacterium]|nr:hypothetical protein [Steroidobacteraceae bacterium]